MYYEPDIVVCNPLLCLLDQLHTERKWLLSDLLTCSTAKFGK